jgi:hypothetical protein
MLGRKLDTHVAEQSKTGRKPLMVVSARFASNNGRHDAEYGESGNEWQMVMMSKPRRRRRRFLVMQKMLDSFAASDEVRVSE